MGQNRLLIGRHNWKHLERNQDTDGDLIKPAVRAATVDLGTRVAMADQATQVAMADQAAKADQGTLWALVGRPWAMASPGRHGPWWVAPQKIILGGLLPERHFGSTEGQLDRTSGGQGELDGTSGGKGELDRTSGGKGELDETNSWGRSGSADSRGRSSGADFRGRLGGADSRRRSGGSDSLGRSGGSDSRRRSGELNIILKL